MGLLHLLRVIRNHIGVPLGVSSNTDAKVVAMLLADVLDEVQGAAEAAFDSRKRLLALGGVAAQCQDILKAICLDLWCPGTSTSALRRRWHWHRG